MKVSYVVPVHNEESILRATVARLRERLATLADVQWEILLVENGSRDRSAAIARELAAASESPRVRAFEEPNAGIGYAYHRGLLEALAGESAADEHWMILTAADLPFDFTDLDAFLAVHDRACLYIGSKAHPRSRVTVSVSRRAASFAYWLARRLVLGMRTGDSQGSIFLEARAARRLVPAMAARDFFYSTELVWRAERAGERVVELPIAIAPALRQSTVRPLRDGARMLRQMLKLRASGARRDKAPG